MMAALLAIYLVLTWVRSVHLFATNRNTFLIEFKDVNGLKVGDPVTIFGHPSGNVTAIRIEKDGAVVEVGLDDEIGLYSDAFGEILVKELMGGKQVDIKPGKSSQPLKDGARIPGRTSLDFSTAFSKFGDFIDRFGEERLDSLFRSINRLADVYGDIGAQIQRQNLDRFFSDLSSTASTLNQLLGQANQRNLVSKVDSAMYTLARLSGKAEEALGSVTGLSDHLQSTTLPNADKMLTEVLGMLNETDQVITGVRDLLNQLKNQETAAGKFLYDPAFAKTVDYTIDNFNKTLDHLRYKKVMIAFTLSKKQPQVKQD